MSDLVRNPEDRFSQNEARISLNYMSLVLGVPTRSDRHKHAKVDELEIQYYPSSEQQMFLSETADVQKDRFLFIRLILRCIIGEEPRLLAKGHTRNIIRRMID